LKRLEARGLVERRQDVRDGRRALVVPTAAGRKLAVNPSGTIEEVVEKVLDEMAPEELVTLRSALGRLATALLDEGSSPTHRTSRRQPPDNSHPRRPRGG
jgi:DNA-binding MarR family transcriptional regulator